MDEYAVIVLHKHSAVGKVTCGSLYKTNKIYVNRFEGFAARNMSLTRICLFDGRTKEILSKLVCKFSESSH